MIHFFRRFFQSKIGLGITFAFLGLIAFAFASSDVANTAVFGGVAGGDRVAVVGDAKISTSDLSRATSNAVDQIRQQDPTITIQAFAEQGGIEDVLDQLIAQTAISEYARKHGLRAGTNLVNSEIIGNPAFRGASGNFDQQAYQGILAQQGLSDALVREQIASGLYAQQLLAPAGFAANAPASIARRYAALARERRVGTIATLPSSAYAPTGNPTNAELTSFYNDNREVFVRPERRVIRYATFGTEALDGSIEPTENEIAARYEQNRAQFAASEERVITQIIVPTEAGANALRARLDGGASIAGVAAEAGFQTSQIGPIEKDALGQQFSTAVANAVFAASRGGIAAPARSGLGWHVVRIDNVNAIAARSLADAREELAETIRAEKRRLAISDLSARVEEEIDEGVALAEMAEQLGAEIQSTAPVTSDGRVFGNPSQTIPPVLGPALSTAFQMQEGEPQLAEIQPGQLFLIYEVSEITESAAPPLAQIRQQAITQWRIDEGSKGARAAADRVLARLGGGTTLEAAIAEEEPNLPGIDRMNLTREQVAQAFQQGVPAPLALMFSMAKGSSKKLEGPSGIGWFVIDLDEISVEEIAANDPLVARTQRELGQALGSEYIDQLTVAMREEVGAERNDPAIAAVRRQLTGEN
ncbi:SurA N-terminal domain-containing protein [Altererythrobacter sp. MF3-039]|uniref:SurA N-terminal domain-containing protein n=1 Tax=Altererythrobacter sp. MF3-039 TaxID=3252901 RepID=UPI00390C6066